MKDVKNIKRCAIMGQHPLQFPWGFDEEDDGCIHMKRKLTQCITALYDMGIWEYQVACDPGIGLYTAEVIHSEKPVSEYSNRLCPPPRGTGDQVDAAAARALFFHAEQLRGSPVF